MNHHTPTPSEHKLLTDIYRLEAHVRLLNNGGDSAYEKALVRAHEQTLEQMRVCLAALRAAGTWAA